MATTVLQQEILDILNIKMPESNQKSDLEENSSESDAQNNSEGLKRLKTDDEERPGKKFKPSELKNLDEDEGDISLSTIELELANKSSVVDSSDSEDLISDDDDDDIKIIQEVSEVTKSTSFISSKLLDVVNSISKEVVEGASKNIVNDILDRSADTGFASDDNVGEQIIQSNSESEESGEARIVVKNDDTYNDDDIDCLLLSSPVKPNPSLVLNPLYHLGSSYSSDDSNSDKSLASVESITLKMSSSEDSSSSSSFESASNTNDKGCNTNEIISSSSSENSRINNDLSNSSQKNSNSSHENGSSSCDIDTGNLINNENSITLISLSGNNSSSAEEEKCGSIVKPDEVNKEIAEAIEDASGENKKSNGILGTLNCNGEISLVTSLRILNQVSDSGQSNVQIGPNIEVDEEDDIMVIDEVKVSKNDEKSKINEIPGRVQKMLKKNVVKNDAKDYLKKLEIKNDVKIDKDFIVTSAVQPVGIPTVKDETIKCEVKTEVKGEFKKEESKYDPTSNSSITLVELDDSEDDSDPVKAEDKSAEKIKNYIKNSVSKLDLTKIKKSFVQCEKVVIPPGVVIPLPNNEADDEIELLDPYIGPDVGPCHLCGQPQDRVSTFTMGSGLDEATAVKDERISVISWKVSLESDWPPCFKATDLSVYDSMGHMVSYDGGLIETGKSLFFSGLLMNIVDDSETLPVDKIGPLTGWRRPDEESTRLILITCLEGTNVEYHVDTLEFSSTYKAALKKELLYKSLSKALNKAPNKQLTKTYLKSTKVQIKSQGVDPKLIKVLSSLPSKTSLKITAVPAPVIKTPLSAPSSRTSRMLKRKSSGSDFDPSGHSTDDDDWSPERSKPSRKLLKRSVTPDNSDDNNDGGIRDSYFKEQMRKVPRILKSLDSSAGSGKSLAMLLPGHNDSFDAVAAFLMFIYERQTIWVNKTNGVMPMTKNKVMSTKWFTNMYRELDRGTTYFRRCIIQTVLKDVDINKDVIQEDLVAKVLFRSIVYRLINKVETFMDFGGLPDLDDFSKFLKFLAKKKSSEVVIFTAAHQNMGYDRLLRTFDFVKKNVQSLASKIVGAGKQKTIKKCQDVLLTIPNVGDFFAWQILCDLLEARILGSCTDNQWACLGPGAKNGLRRVFSLPTTKGQLEYTRRLRDLCAPSGHKSGFAALGLKFPAFLHKPLSLKNVEHALCEYDKYFRSALGVQIKEREYSEQKSRSGLDNKSKCIDCGQQSSTSTRVMCALCSKTYHKKCEMEWETGFHADGTWLCKECHINEEAWSKEDFEYEEKDKNDDMGKVYCSGAAKKEARLKLKAKKHKKEKKVKEILCIDLSSDEEGDEDENESEEEEAESDDEVEYLEEIKGHFFGVDYDDTICNNSETEDNINIEQDEDPFAGVGVWFTEESEDTNQNESDGLGDEEILILS